MIVTIQSISLQTIFSHDLFPDIVYNLSSLPSLSFSLFTQISTLSALILRSETLPLVVYSEILNRLPGAPWCFQHCGRVIICSLKNCLQLVYVFVSSNASPQWSYMEGEELGIDCRNKLESVRPRECNWKFHQFLLSRHYSVFWGRFPLLLTFHKSLYILPIYILKSN